GRQRRKGDSPPSLGPRGCRECGRGMKILQKSKAGSAGGQGRRGARFCSPLPSPPRGEGRKREPQRWVCTPADRRLAVVLTEVRIALPCPEGPLSAKVFLH